MDHSILDSYLVPNPADKELVVLTDSEMSGGVMASRSNTVVLSGPATRILHSHLIGAVSAPIREILSAEEERIEDATIWIRDLNEDNILSLSDTSPSREVRKSVGVKQGSYIAVRDFTATELNDGRGIQLEYPGEVTEVVVGETTIYWYEAKISLQEKNFMTAGRHVASVAARGPFGTSIYPKPVPSALGANCNVCAVCGGCGACGACGLCGGVDFGAAAIAIVAVDAALTVTNAALPISVLRATRT